MVCGVGEQVVVQVGAGVWRMPMAAAWHVFHSPQEEA